VDYVEVRNKSGIYCITVYIAALMKCG